jgi:hypothetical protein
MAHGGVNRDFPFYFFRGRIACCFAGFHSFRAGNNSSGKQQMFKKRGFTGLSMTSDGNIFYLVC